MISTKDRFEVNLVSTLRFGTAAARGRNVLRTCGSELMLFWHRSESKANFIVKGVNFFPAVSVLLNRA